MINTNYNFLLLKISDCHLLNDLKYIALLIFMESYFISKF